MNYKLERKDITLNGKQKIIGHGYTGNVYQYGNYALKIFDKVDDVLDEETARYLSTIRTSRILLPKKLIYYKDKFKGYSMKLISNKPNSKSIINLPKDKLLEDIELLEDDVTTLSSKRVLLNGMNLNNLIFNGNLYITDPSRYSLLELSDLDKIFNLDDLNQFQLYLLLNNIIIQELNKIQKQSGVSELKELLDEKDSNISYSEYLSEIIGQNNNIKTLVKKL